MPERGVEDCSSGLAAECRLKVALMKIDSTPLVGGPLKPLLPLLARAVAHSSPLLPSLAKGALKRLAASVTRRGWPTQARFSLEWAVAIASPFPLPIDHVKRQHPVLVTGSQ